jgi:hypothetical protein
MINICRIIHAKIHIIWHIRSRVPYQLLERLAVWLIWGNSAWYAMRYGFQHIMFFPYKIKYWKSSGYLTGWFFSSLPWMFSIIFFPPITMVYLLYELHMTYKKKDHRTSSFIWWYLSTFIIYLVVIMQNLQSMILAMSQSPISERCAKNAYQYQHACKKCISVMSQWNKSAVKYFRN